VSSRTSSTSCGHSSGRRKPRTRQTRSSPSRHPAAPNAIDARACNGFALAKRLIFLISRDRAARLLESFRIWEMLDEALISYAPDSEVLKTEEGEKHLPAQKETCLGQEGDYATDAFCISN
jgi:hypothetical protein